MSRFSRVFSGMAVGFKASRYAQALGQLSDRQLADMGIARSDIGRRAMEMAERRD